jgi:hypothetical protein
MLSKVKLFSLEYEWSNLETIGLIIAKVRESYTDLVLKLEDTSVVDWSFLFQDVEEKFKINVKFEKPNTILP